MSTLLRVDASIRLDGSVSRALADSAEAAWKAEHPDGVVVRRDLGLHPLAARIQDPGAARLQLTVRNLETAIDLYKRAGPSAVVSSRGDIITQPGYRVAVVSDLNGLFLVLTDRRVTR